MKMKNTLTLAAVALASVPFASAALVNVNFDRFTGGGIADPIESTLVGPGGGLGTDWNRYADEDSTGALVDSTGAASTITFTTNFTEGRGGTATDQPVFHAVLSDFGKGVQNRNLIVSGLANGGSYDIWLMAYRDNGTAGERLGGYYSTTNATSSSSTQLMSSFVTRNGTTFEEGVNYILFSDVVATVGGVITFDIDAGLATDDDFTTDVRSGLSAFQISAVPEPSTTALLGLGGLALILRRRK
jgi:hypothetical protein